MYNEFLFVKYALTWVYCKMAQTSPNINECGK